MIATLPLFPLSTVLLPGSALPLHVFEPRYRQLVLDLVNEVVEDRRFGVIGIKQGWEVGEDNVESMHEIGCSATLDEVHQLPEGRYDVVGTGENRFRLLDIDTEAAPYLMGRVEWLPDTEPAPESPSADRLAASARAAHERYHSTGLRGEARATSTTDLETDMLAYALAEDCVLSADDRQEVLAETDPLARLRLVRRVLLREAEFLRELRAIPAPFTEFAQHTSVN